MTGTTAAPATVPTAAPTARDKQILVPGGAELAGVHDAKEVSGDGSCNSRTDMEVHRPPPRNKPAAVAAHNIQAAVAERHTPLAV